MADNVFSIVVIAAVIQAYNTLNGFDNEDVQRDFDVSDSALCGADSITAQQKH